MSVLHGPGKVRNGQSSKRRSRFFGSPRRDDPDALAVPILDEYVYEGGEPTCLSDRPLFTPPSPPVLSSTEHVLFHSHVRRQWLTGHRNLVVFHSSPTTPCARQRRVGVCKLLDADIVTYIEDIIVGQMRKAMER
jgi:hypothetical protein